MILTVVSILVMACLIILGIILAYELRKSQKISRIHDEKMAAKEREKQERAKPEYILTHSPSWQKIKRILEENPNNQNLKNLALQAVLNSQDTSIIFATDYFPAQRNDILDRYSDLVLSRKSLAEQLTWIEKNELFLQGGQRKSWLEFAREQRVAEEQRSKAEARAKMPSHDDDDPYDDDDGDYWEPEDIDWSSG